MAFDAFISYSHAADGLLAPRLQDGLQRFAKPWWRRRALHIFRDETGLGASPAMWSSIAAAMEASDWFVLLASPDAADSVWVNREIEYWKAHKPTGRILPVVTEGDWAWSEERGEFDLAASTAVPASLVGVFAEEPLFVDMRWARGNEQLDLNDGRFRDQVAAIAAPIRGEHKDDLAGLDVREHRRTVRTAWAAAIGLLFLTLLAGMAALVAARNANDARTAQQLADKNAAEANQQRAAAETNAASADRERNAADQSAQDATRQRAAAEQSAEEATRQRAAADASAALALSQQQAAEQSAAEATQQQHAAEASAETARLAQLDADRSAADAIMQKQAADAASAQLVQANTQLDQSNRSLEAQKAELAQKNQDLATANAELLTANGDLDAARLVASADAERLGGDLDTAMLLANEAIAAAKTDASPARNEALIVQNDARYLERYLPGSGDATPASASLITGPGHVAQLSGTARSFVRVWDLTNPAAGPATVDLGKVTNAAASMVGFSHDGRRLIVVAADSTVSVWDVARVDQPLYSVVASWWELSPDRTALAVETSINSVHHVTLLDLGDPGLGTKGTWDGALIDSQCRDDVVGRSAASPNALVPTECAFSHDGRHVLARADGRFVLWSTENPQLVSNLYTPTGTGRNFTPRFIVAGSALVVGVVDDDTVKTFDGDGNVVQKFTVPSGVEAFAVAGGGTEASLVSGLLGDSPQVTRFDFAAGSAGPIATLPSESCTDASSPAVRFSPLGQWIMYHGACPNSAWLIDDSGRVAKRFLADCCFDPPIAFGREGSTETDAIYADGRVIDVETGAFSQVGRGGQCLADANGDRLVCDDVVVELDEFQTAPPGGRSRLGAGLFPYTFDTTGSKLLGLTANGGRMWLGDVDASGVGAVASVTTTPSAPAGRRWSVLSQDGSHLLVDGPKGATVRNLWTGVSVDVAVPQNLVGQPFFAGNDRIVVPAIPTAKVVDATTGAIMGPIHGDVVTSGDGTLLAQFDASDADGAVNIRGPQDFGFVLRRVPGLRVSRSTTAAALNRDGSLFAAFDVAQQRVVVVDTFSGVVKGSIADANSRFSQPTLAFSRDGRFVAAAEFGNLQIAVKTFDLMYGTVSATTRIPSNDACVSSDAEASQSDDLQYSPDGLQLLARGQLIDARTLAPAGSPLGCTPWTWGSGRFHSDGSLEYVVYRQFAGPGAATLRSDVHALPLAATTLVQQGCALAGRNLTQAEWLRFEPGVRYRPTCKQWPVGP